MIQRIQSLLLLGASLLNLAILFLPIWQVSQGEGTATFTGFSVNLEGTAANGINGGSVGLGDDFLLLGHFLMVIIASLYLIFVIFQYKDRMKQIRLVYIGLVLVLGQIALASGLSYGLGEHVGFTEQGQGSFEFGFFFPIGTILLAWFAARRIKADEDLVRSADRIR
ncbi:MAG: DUF4293 domain-containing protein [Bacteroidia bacterium]|nr:DUF4293 domain-containing protein [Bacteroidia bacterium]